MIESFLGRGPYGIHVKSLVVNLGSRMRFPIGLPITLILK